MKNVHVLPTDKPSRLKQEYINMASYALSRQPLTWRFAQHIYITSDEEIKEGDWKIVKYEGQSPQVVKSEYANSVNNLYTLEYQAKIILTTDQELIKAGIQAIDDEFLEWFVKNPGCEEVEVNKRYSDFTVDPFVGYKIIIPKEEPKQELLPDFKITKNIFDFVTDLSDTKKEEPKKETLEEAAIKYATETNGVIVNQRKKQQFTAGAKWQAERMYSEEDLRKAWEDGRNNLKTVGTPPFVITKFQHNSFNEWFEQFKKK